MTVGTSQTTSRDKGLSTVLRENRSNLFCVRDGLMQSPTPAFIDQLRFNEAGLIPAIAQDWLDVPC